MYTYIHTHTHIRTYTHIHNSKIAGKINLKGNQNKRRFYLWVSNDEIALEVTPDKASEEGTCIFKVLWGYILKTRYAQPRNVCVCGAGEGEGRSCGCICVSIPRDIILQKQRWDEDDLDKWELEIHGDRRYAFQ